MTDGHIIFEMKLKIESVFTTPIVKLKRDSSGQLTRGPKSKRCENSCLISDMAPFNPIEKLYPS